MSDEAPVLLDVEGQIATITLNRPHRKNAQTAEGWALLFDHLRTISYDDSIRAVVLTGAGGAFCAGADVSGVPGGHPLTRVRNISRTPEALYSLNKPVIAKVEGAAVGAGWNMALCCDFVVASSTAKFSQIFAKRGLNIDFGGAWLLPRLAGLQQAKRLAYLADFVSPQEAKELGLVTWVKEPDEIDGFVADLAGRLAAMPPIAIAQTKDLLHNGVVQSFRDVLDNEARAQAINYATEDAPAAFKAFADKTEVEFTGKWAL
ncbi:enoyl-CoA hydratase [Aeromicrobium sp. 636]|uniref:Enoyl-CoA hydratase/isomerase family protein n=1 Tax=Aeromicrobium senzhongii TaxID=2663859 RepID=A0A8I0K208_9ACTN|nr:MULTISPECIES: enoyl-CoA hydratase-related protein [Aeromicrobium]MBC9227633.1 enoyl-CoA hydratase/isomerase family protein [Aeromicrobium senzhongii]MCQ3999730.1 enoyl-CoA hydratase [Aeromicrobium sp. 636]